MRAEKAGAQAAPAADPACPPARDALPEIKERAADHASRLAALTQTAADVDAELTAAEVRAREAGEALDALPALAPLAKLLEGLLPGFPGDARVPPTRTGKPI